jgi:DNA-directed RNA polymerase specialized sigma24 family protein
MQRRPSVLFDRYHRLVLSIAPKIVRDPGEAEDVMQSVFPEIFRSVAQFDPAKGTTKVWILQYAYHRAINRRQHLNAREFYDQTNLDEVDTQRPCALASTRRKPRLRDVFFPASGTAQTWKVRFASKTRSSFKSKA